jgi:hypothetical protein
MALNVAYLQIDLQALYNYRKLNTISLVTYKHTDWWEGFTKYSAEMRCSVILKTSKVHKDWFRHSEVDTIVSQAHRMGLSVLNVKLHYG